MWKNNDFPLIVTYCTVHQMNDQPINSTSKPTSMDKTKSGVRAPRKPKRGVRGLLNFILFIAIIVVIALFVRAEMERRAAEAQLQEKAAELQQLKETAERSGQQVADQVLEKLRRHIVLPGDPAPTVATIVDIEQLKQANDFYSPAKNGDHLIITQDRAILYDPDRDLILDIVPVQINQQQAADALSGDQPVDGSASPSPATTVSGAPTATATPRAAQ